MPKGSGWKMAQKTPTVPRVSMTSVVSRVSVISEGISEEVVGRDRHSVARAEERVPTILEDNCS